MLAKTQGLGGGKKRLLSLSADCLCTSTEEKQFKGKFFSVMMPVAG